ncbi:hypothetical protein [Halpernia sp. GG3]
MNSDKKKIFLYFLFGALGGILVMYLMNGFPADKSTETQNKTAKVEAVKSASQISAIDISQITKAETVITFVKTNHQLPSFYLTKKRSKKTRMESFKRKSL